MSTEKPKKRSKGVIPLIFLFTCACLSVFFARNSKDDKNSVADPTTVISPTEQVTEAPITEEPTSIPAMIPGIWQADVTENLKSRFGMICSELEEGNIYYSRSCKKESGTSRIDVVVYGKGILNVDFVSSTYTDIETTDTETAEKILGFIATIPFVDNSDLQAQALEWVKTNLPAINNGSEYAEAETEINNVHFSINGKNKMITLEIGELTE